MGDVGIRLLAAVDAVESGYLGLSQSLHLWKDIPHPVSTLVAVSHFFERLGISAGVFVNSTAVLGMNKSEQIALPRLISLMVTHFSYLFN